MRIISRRPLAKLLQRPVTPKLTSRGLPMMGHDPAALESSFPGLIELMTAAGNIPDAASSFASLLHRVLRLHGARPDSALDAEELQRLGVRPLAIWGAEDPFGDQDAARRFSEATSGRLEIAGRGHFPWLDDVTRTSELIAGHLGTAAGG